VNVGRKQRLRVSVLFSEPKIPQYAVYCWCDNHLS